MKKTGLTTLCMLAAGLWLPLAGCVKVEKEQQDRLQALERKQDSILVILETMREQSEFVALRMGWQPPPDTTAKEIPLGNSFSEGPDDAAVTLVEFSDLQCPYCARLAPVLDSVRRAYPNDVRLVFKHFPLPFHEQARAAAAAAVAAGNQGKFFEFRSRVAPHFRNLNRELYLEVAEELGLDMRRFRREMELTAEMEALFDADMSLGRRLGVQGTPTIFVNGRDAAGRSFAYFSSEVEKARAEEQR